MTGMTRHGPLGALLLPFGHEATEMMSLIRNQAAPCGISDRAQRQPAPLKIEKNPAKLIGVKTFTGIDFIGVCSLQGGRGQTHGLAVHDTCMTDRLPEKTPSNTVSNLTDLHMHIANTTSGPASEGITNRNLTAVQPASTRTKKRLGVKVGHVFIPIWKSKCRGSVLYQVAKPRVPGVRRKLATFTTLEAAGGYARSLAMGEVKQQEVFARVSAEALRDTGLVADLLKPLIMRLGITVEQAVREYCAAKEIAAKRCLHEVARDYLAQPWVMLSRTPFPEVIEKFIEAKRNKGCRRETLRTLRYALEPFGRSIGNPPIGDITTDQLNARIHRPGYSKRGNKTIYCGLHNLYVWLKRHGYLRPDQPTAMDRVECPMVEKKIPDIVSLELVPRLFGTLVDCGDIEGALVVALGLFSGIRMDEMQRLIMEKHIDPGQRLCITGELSKTRLTRVAPILPVLDAWLRPFYGRKGFLHHRRDPQIRLARILKNHGINWSKNWLRHSYCSYRLAATGDVLETAKEAGHSVYVLTNTYLNLVVKAKGEAFFALTPEACGIPNWPELVARHIELAGECHDRKKYLRRDKPQKDTVPQNSDHPNGTE